jgi:transcriptional regulator
VPTWNYVEVHAYGAVEFFHEEERLREVVTRLTDRHEGARANPWAVADAPADFVAMQLRGIVGLRIPVERFEGKRKLSQNRPEPDRINVARGLSASADPRDQEVAPLIKLPT